MINSFQNKIVEQFNTRTSLSSFWLNVHSINLFTCSPDAILCTLKKILECFILTNETKIPLNGFVLGACYTCLWHSWNLFSTCKTLSDLFWKHCSFVYCIFSIAITVVNNFNFTWYKIVHCEHFLQNTRIYRISSNFHRSYKTIFAYISHTNQFLHWNIDI